MVELLIIRACAERYAVRDPLRNAGRVDPLRIEQVGSHTAIVEPYHDRAARAVGGTFDVALSVRRRTHRHTTGCPLRNTRRIDALCEYVAAALTVVEPHDNCAPGAVGDRIQRHLSVLCTTDQHAAPLVYAESIDSLCVDIRGGIVAVGPEDDRAARAVGNSER